MSKTLVLGTIVAVVGLFAFVGFFLWQQVQENRSLQEQYQVLEGNIDQLTDSRDFLRIGNSELQKEREVRTTTVEILRTQEEEFQNLISYMTGSTKGNLPSFPEKKRSLKVIAPNGGENLCLNEEFEIRWEGSNIQLVQITLKKGGFGYRVAEYYPAEGSFQWKAGELVNGRSVVEPGEYFLTITSYDGGFGLFDESDSPFFITRCIG